MWTIVTIPNRVLDYICSEPSTLNLTWIYVSLSLCKFYLSYQNFHMNNQMFLHYTFILSNKFLDYAFKQCINWPVAVILSNRTFSWKTDGGGGNLFLVVGFYLIYCLHVYSSLLFYGFQSCASRAETCFPPWPCVGNDEWVVMRVISSTCLVLILNLLLIELTNNFSGVSGCDSFFIKMSGPKTRKNVTVSRINGHSTLTRWK